MKCECEVIVGRLLQEKETEVPKTPCPIASLSTTYFTWVHMELNP